MITTENGIIKPKKPVEVPAIKRGGMIDLDHVEPIDFIVDELISPGLAMIASAPKDGKSWLVLLLCLCISLGRSFLGYTTHQCSVLYLALEDSDNRLRARIKRLFDGNRLPDAFIVNVINIFSLQAP